MGTAKIIIPDSFFGDEERCGYLVSDKMKHVWAVQLEMLKELERVCQKYGLTYYADSGTLIGAIRHKGYIPWDDDIDLVMFREDYQKLLKIADKEFQYPFFLQSVYSDEKYIRGLAKLRNSATTAIDEADLNRPFNHGIFIDIFPLDSIPDNELILRIWCRKIKFIRQLLRNWAYFDTTPKKNVVELIIRKTLKTVVDKIGYKNVYGYLEKTCGYYNNKNTKRVSYVAYSYGKKKHIWKKSWFKKTCRVPFEFTDINIPNGYDKRLRVEYGDYMVMKNIPSSHGAVVLEPDIPYEEYLRNHDPEAEIAKMLHDIKANEQSSISSRANPNLKFHIIEKPDWIGFDEIADVLHDAHRSNVERGMHFVASYQDGEETKRRLGECGKFFVALTDDNQIAGVGAVSIHKSCKDWYARKQPCCEIKMVGVPEKYKGMGISSALYQSLEEFGFSVNDLLIMNTAKDNHIVLDSNARHGWKYVDFKSWSRTDYYSVCMAKWKNGCPYSDRHCQFMYTYRKLYTLLVREKSGKLRFPFSIIKNESEGTK